jgi:hypothetical protein
MNSAGASVNVFQRVRTVVEIVLPAERDAAIAGSDGPAVRDGNAVRVAGEIAQHLLGPGERRLDVNDPFDVSPWPEEALERGPFGNCEMVVDEPADAADQDPRPRRAACPLDSPPDRQGGRVSAAAPAHPCRHTPLATITITNMTRHLNLS